LALDAVVPPLLLVGRHRVLVAVRVANSVAAVADIVATRI
jgi:hypothetical protein